LIVGIVRLHPCSRETNLVSQNVSGCPPYRVALRSLHPRKTKSRQPLVIRAEGASKSQRITVRPKAHRDHASETHGPDGRQTGDAQALKIVLALTGFIDSV
jgi:hypothetical protein